MFEAKFTIAPLELSHVVDIWELAHEHPNVWEFVASNLPEPTSRVELQAICATNIANPTMQNFAMIELATGRAVGFSSFLDIRPADQHVEIGNTFIAPQHRGGTTNLEIKLQMLTKAFEELDCVRVSFKANALNERSRAAIEKIGAKFEGIFRNQRLERNGVWRDASYYSVIIEEWPEVKAHISELIEKLK